MPRPASRLAVVATTLMLTAHVLPAAAANIYVNVHYTGAVETGSAVFPFRTVRAAYDVAHPGDVLVIQSGVYHESIRMNLALQLVPNGGDVVIGRQPWGHLANPGFEGQAIRSTLFFCGQPLDGSGSVNVGDWDYNGCGPSAQAMGCYSRTPIAPCNLHWTDPANPAGTANRDTVLQAIADAGFNVISMSSWGERGLPCTTGCPDPAICSHEARCRQDPFGNWTCRIGWFGAANMQITGLARDQLFDETVGRPLLVMPFIESRFGMDWDFHDDFPTDALGRVAPGLVSQVEDLIDRYLLHPANPAWPSKWARVSDQSGNPRYAVTIIQAASAMLDTADAAADAKFAAGFDAVAQKILADRNVAVGFFIDPIPRRPDSTWGGVPASNLADIGSLYGPDPLPAPQRPWFKPDPATTGPLLRAQQSILGIQCYSPEGWIDTVPWKVTSVTEGFKLGWKQSFSRRWYATGIPFLHDVTPGYDGSILFADRPNGLKEWGYDTSWQTGLAGLVDAFGQGGMVWNSWNGYCEGLSGMPVNGNPDGGQTVPWMKSLTARYR